jgi:DNA-directed RNA polymerase subunit RPC12/RpoP
VTTESTEEKCQQCGEPINFKVSQGQASAGFPDEVLLEGRCPKCGHVEHRHFDTRGEMSI